MRGALGVFFAVLKRAETPTHSFHYQLIASLVALAYSGTFLLLQSRYDLYRPWVKYYTTAADVLIVTALLWSFGEYRTVKTDAQLIYFPLVALARYRYSIRLTVYADALSVASYIGLAVASFTFDRVEAGAIASSFVTPAVSVLHIAVRISIFAFFIVVMVAIAWGYDRLIDLALHSERRASEEEQKTKTTREVLSRYVTHQMVEFALQRGCASKEKGYTRLFCSSTYATSLASARA